MDADQSLLDLVFDRLATDKVPDEVASLVLAAYTGADELRAALAGQSPDLPTSAEQHTIRMDPLYVNAVTVAGFRGIGPQASLRLAPHAGLTLVVGRNGSGKSSFAEAAELALTGDSLRWAERNSVFREGWRNLHCGSPCAIELVLRADGAAVPIRITRPAGRAECRTASDSRPETRAQALATQPARVRGRVPYAAPNRTRPPGRPSRPILTDGPATVATSR